MYRLLHATQPITVYDDEITPVVANDIRWEAKAGPGYTPWTHHRRRAAHRRNEEGEPMSKPGLVVCR